MDEESAKSCIQDRLRTLLGSKEDQAIYLSFISITIIVLLFMYVPPLKQYWDSFYPAVMATFLGIYLGFTIDRIFVRVQRKSEIKNLLKGIRNELEYIKNRIYPQTKAVFRIQSPEWDSAISSGQLQLLKIEERRALSIVYTTIKYSNYDAMHVRAAAEDRDRAQGDEKEYLLKLVKRKHGRHNRLGEELTKEIEDVLKMDFFAKISNDEKSPGK